jgi:hypothetical protein
VVTALPTASSTVLIDRNALIVCFSPFYLNPHVVFPLSSTVLFLLGLVRRSNSYIPANFFSQSHRFHPFASSITFFFSWTQWRSGCSNSNLLLVLVTVIHIFPQIKNQTLSPSACALETAEKTASLLGHYATHYKHVRASLKVNKKL